MKNKKRLYTRVFLSILTAILLVAGLAFMQRQPPSPEIGFGKISSFREFKGFGQKCDEHTLIFFDVDDTLIYGPDLFPWKKSTACFWWFRFRAVIAHRCLLKPSAWEHYYSIMWQQAPRHLIESKSVIFIDTLKAQGCRVFGLTSMETGSYGVIPDMPEWRYAMLASLGIEFTQDFGTKIFSSLPAYRDNYPMLYKGIVCANGLRKGPVLGAFLDTLDFKPTQIIFFDDREKELQSVGAECKKHAIPCELYRYDGYKEIPDRWSMDWALKQLNGLVVEEKWIENVS